MAGGNQSIEKLFDQDHFDPDRFGPDMLPSRPSPEEEIAALREPVPESLRDDQPEARLSTANPPAGTSLADVVGDQRGEGIRPETEDDPMLSRAELAFFRDSLNAERLANADRAAGEEPFQFD